MIKMKLHTQIILAIILGVVIGFQISEQQATYIEPIGDLFIRLLKMIIMPLILASIVTGITSIGNVRHLGRLGGKTFAYYLTTTFLSVTTGLVLVNLMAPGLNSGLPLADPALATDRDIPGLGNMLTDIVPKNFFHALANDQVLSVIFFSLLFGSAITAVGEKAKPLVQLFDGFFAVMMRVTDWIMRLAPFGVFALMAVMVARTGIDSITEVAKYMATVLLGLSIHAFITLPLLLFFVAGVSPIKFAKHMFSALATAFSTASSAATLPLTMDCLEKNAGVSNKTGSFVLPLGATMNMDGTALYEAVAAIFIANVYGVDLSMAQQVLIAVTATLASIGAAAVPSAGLVMMVLVLKAVNLPIEGIALVAGVDRMLDMCRTTVNVWGDSCGAAVVARLEGETLEPSSLAS